MNAFTAITIFDAINYAIAIYWHDKKNIIMQSIHITNAPLHRLSIKTSTECYVQNHQTWLACVAPPPHHQEQNSLGSPLCCQKVDEAELTLQSFTSNRAPGPRSSFLSTSRCTSVSSKVWGFHVPISVVFPWSRAEHQFTSAHDARSRRPFGGNIFS